MISPRVCEPWCTEGTGHPGASSRADQWCGSASPIVELSLEDPQPQRDGTWFTSYLEANAVARFGEYPVVELHVLFEDRRDVIDRSFKLTAAEAHQLAANLTTAAALIAPPV